MKYPLVFAHEARQEILPEIPDDLGSRDSPILELNGLEGMEFYREGGVWWYRNPSSRWLPEAWVIGDWVYQRQLTMSWARGSMTTGA